MDNETVQHLFAFLQPQSNGPIVGQSELRKTIARARARALAIEDNDSRNLWLVLIQLIDVQFLGSIN